MEEKTLGELVKAAKGADRTLKEYEKASGVDAAVISKIISGKYLPKKTKVLKALTSEVASPRGGVTYEQLVDAAGISKSLEEGMMAGVAATQSVLKAIGEIPIYSLSLTSKTNPYVAISQLAILAAKAISMKAEGKTEEKEDNRDGEVENTINDIQRFVATANGLIYGAMGQKGILFKPEPQTENENDSTSISTYLTLQGSEIEQYYLKYIYLNSEDRKQSFIIENTAKRIIEQLVFLKPNKRRKVSIVVNCKESYDYLMRFKNKLSYKGILSVVLVNDNKVCVESEEILSEYGDDEENNRAMLIIE